MNLFDLGIVLSVAFLLAALSSLDLESAVFSSTSNRQVPEDTVVAKPNEDVRSIRLNSGERVVGRGEQVGTVYRLTDGRTVIVQGKDDGAGSGTDGAPADQSDDGGTTTNDAPPVDGEAPGADEPTLGDPGSGTDEAP